MAARSCRVTITDLEGITHPVEVTATSLYEAIALGLMALRGNQWVMDIAVDDEVKMKVFVQWVD